MELISVLFYLVFCVCVFLNILFGSTNAVDNYDVNQSGNKCKCVLCMTIDWVRYNTICSMSNQLHIHNQGSETKNWGRDLCNALRINSILHRILQLQLQCQLIMNGGRFERMQNRERMRQMKENEETESERKEEIWISCCDDKWMHTNSVDISVQNAFAFNFICTEWKGLDFFFSAFFVSSELSFQWNENVKQKQQNENKTNFNCAGHG